MQKLFVHQNVLKLRSYLGAHSGQWIWQYCLEKIVTSADWYSYAVHTATCRVIHIEKRLFHIIMCVSVFYMCFCVSVCVTKCMHFSP